MRALGFLQDGVMLNASKPLRRGMQHVQTQLSCYLEQH